MSCSASGSPETVRRELAALVECYKPDEIMVTEMIHDHAARLQSFAIAAEALSDITQASKASKAAYGRKFPTLVAIHKTSLEAASTEAVLDDLYQQISLSRKL